MANSKLSEAKKAKPDFLDVDKDGNKEEPMKWEVAPATLDSIFDGEGPHQWRAVLDKAAKYQVSAWF